MPRRIAATMSLIVFAVCLVAGLEAENTLATILWKALVGMAGTLIVGLVIGAMAQRMLDENVAARKPAEAVEPAPGGQSGPPNKSSPPASGKELPQAKPAGNGR